jgi:hypothetical protein
MSTFEWGNRKRCFMFVSNNGKMKKLSCAMGQKL